MSTTAPEYLATLRDGVTEAVQQWMDQSNAAWEQWSRAWAPGEGMAPWLAPAAPAPPGRRTGSGRGRRQDHAHAHGHTHGHCDGHGEDQSHDHGEGRGHDHDHDHAHHHDRCGSISGDHGCGCGGGRSGYGCGATRGCGCAGQDQGCGCGDRCRCCVPEADVIVRARIGEVRVVPFHLSNPWRRERPVSLEIGPWHGCDGDGLTVRAMLEEESIVLAPCEDRVVRLLVAVRPTVTDDPGDGSDPKDNQTAHPEDGPQATNPAGAESDPAATRDEALKAREAREARLDAVRGDGQGRVIGDVEGCATAYADVRFEGCARPQRVAVVVLPAECDAVDVGCDCGCCCQERWTHE